MKIINIHILTDLEDIDIENGNVDVSVKANDGYTYTLSVATPKNIQFLMDKENMNYYEPGHPFIFVNKLTSKIIEQAVKAFAEKDRGVLVKVLSLWRMAWVYR